MGSHLINTFSRLRNRLPGRENERARTRGLASVTALEVDGTTLRVAEVTRSAGASRINSIHALPLDFADGANRSDPALLGTVVARALAKAHLQPGPVIMAIPRGNVLLRTVTVPDTGSEGTIASLVRFQIVRELPFRADEAIIDFQIIRRLPARPTTDDASANVPSPSPSSDSVDRVEVLVAVAKRESITFLSQLAQSAGLQLAALGWASHANATWLRATTDPAPNSTRAAILLRPEEVGIEIIEDGAILFSRGVPLAARPDSESTEWIRSVTLELVRTLHSFASSSTRSNPTSAYVFGGTGRESLVADALQTRLGFPVNCPDIAARLALDRSQQNIAQASFAVLGLALGITDPGGLPFDFLNPKRPTPPTDMRRVKIIAGTFIGILLLICLFSLRSSLVNRRRTVLTQLQEELASGEKKRPTYRQIIQQANTLRTWSSEDRDWLDHYAYLSAIFPPSEEVYLTSIAFGPGKAIRLGAQARNGEILSKLDRQLRAAGYEVKPLAVTPGADRNGYGFRTTVELSVPSKLKFDLTKLVPPARPTDDISLDAPRKGGSR